MLLFKWVKRRFYGYDYGFRNNRRDKSVNTSFLIHFNKPFRRNWRFSILLNVDDLNASINIILVIEKYSNLW